MPFHVKKENYTARASKSQIGLLRSLGQCLAQPSSMREADLRIKRVLAIVGPEQLKAWRRKVKARRARAT